MAKTKAWRKKKTPGGRSLTGGTILTLADNRTRADALLAQFEKAYKFGHRFAALSGLDICVRANLPLPPWLAQAVREILLPALESGQDVKTWLADQKHLQRYRAVLRYRDKGARWSDAYVDASDDSREESWQGSADAMQKSYGRVARTIEKNRGQYWHPQDAVDAVESIFKMFEMLPRVRHEVTPVEGPWRGWRGWLYHPPEGKK